MMSESITPILQWLNDHPNLAGLVTFLISAGESIAIIGTIIPGTITMTAIGTLAGAGVIPLWSTIGWAILGAAIGDNLSYWVGRYFKDRLPHFWPFRTHPNLLWVGEKFFHKYGIIGVFIGRFIGPVRAIVPIVAGMLGMKPIRYIPVSIIASIAWAPVYMLPGILLGAATLEFPPDVAVHVLLILLLVSLFIIFCIWMAYKLFMLVKNQINQFLNLIWQRLRVSRYFHVVTLALKHHNPAKTHGQLALAFYFILTFTVFIYLAIYVHFHDSAGITVNKVIYNLFRSWRTPTMDRVMLGITMLGDKMVLLPVIFALLVWLGWNRRWYTATHTVLLFVITGASVVFFKHAVHSTRSWGILKSPETFSFPSGHTTLSTIFYVALGLLIIHFSRIRYKRLFYFFIGLIVASISLSRIYLGAHWFTDVVGAWLLSISILMLICISYNRQKEANINIRDILSLLLLTLAISWGFQFYYNYDRLKHNYSELSRPTTAIDLNSWWEQKDDNLPLYRIGRVGLPAEIFNIQWIGDINDIHNTLVRAGWETPPQHNWVSVLLRVSDVTSTEHLPLLSPLYLDKTPALVLIKYLPKSKKVLVVRLWDSNTIVKGTNQPLWLGSVVFIPRTYSWLFNYKNRNVPLNSTLIFPNYPAQYEVKEFAVNVENKRKHRWLQQPMLLIKPKFLKTSS